MEPVAAGDHVAGELLRRAVVAEGDARAVGGKVVHRDVGGLEQDRLAGGEAGGDQVLHHLVLAVDGDVPAGEGGEVDPVVAAGEAQVHAVVRQALAPQAVADAGGDQQVLDAVFQHAGADAVFHVLARAGFQHHRLDAAQVQQVGEQQAGGTGADDANLGAHGRLLRKGRGRGMWGETRPSRKPERVRRRAAAAAGVSS